MQDIKRLRFEIQREDKIINAEATYNVFGQSLLEKL
jgi:hypothetical protein